MTLGVILAMGQARCRQAFLFFLFLGIYYKKDPKVLHPPKQQRKSGSSANLYSVSQQITAAPILYPNRETKRRAKLVRAPRLYGNPEARQIFFLRGAVLGGGFS